MKNIYGRKEDLCDSCIKETVCKFSKEYKGLVKEAHAIQEMETSQIFNIKVNCIEYKQKQASNIR